MKTLSTGECRLLLLSDCIKYFPEVAEHTAALRKLDKRTIIRIVNTDAKEISAFLSSEEVDKIKAMLKREWYFTDRVLDNGKGRTSTCEYCQSQKIRYRYVCKNKINGNVLELGSVCVGNIIHGEEAMRNKDFSNKFVSKLDSLKGNAVEDVDHQKVRESQYKTIAICSAYLSNNGYANDDFVESLHKRWNEGLSLTDKQMEALKDKCRRVREYKKRDTGMVTFKTQEALMEYKKVLSRLELSPNSEFLQSCKLRLERHGELTTRMSKALAGTKTKEEVYNGRQDK